jgi:hypothetical protein
MPRKSARARTMGLPSGLKDEITCCVDARPLRMGHHDCTLAMRAQADTATGAHPASQREQAAALSRFTHLRLHLHVAG